MACACRTNLPNELIETRCNGFSIKFCALNIYFIYIKIYIYYKDFKNYEIFLFFYEIRFKTYNDKVNKDKIKWINNKIFNLF